MATEKESLLATLRTKFFLRGKQGVEAIWGPPSHANDTSKIERDESFGSPRADIMEFSKDGSMLVLVDSQVGFVVRNTETSEEVLQVENAGIQAIAWSPLGSHLLSWQRPQKDQEHGNLIVWKVATGEAVARFNQKIFSKDAWPSVEWSADETICARQSANGVQLYNGRDLTAGTAGQIVLPNTTSFSLAPGPPPYKIAVFVPEKKGKPASVKIYQFPGLEIVVAAKSFYKAQDVTMKWSPNGSALVIETRTDVDTTGKSYYGESGLFFMQSDGQYDCIVPLTKEGSVHDVQWDPTGRGFVVLAGAMPCNATLYDNKAIPIFEFGAAPRNHVSWSPHGRFLCIAGFGNLRGDMDFWDRNKLKKIGSANSNSATCFTWSADSRYFLTATTFPRLRVDNGFKVFKYDGTGPVHQEDRAELYDMKFRPALPDVYPNRPQSPRKKGEEAAAAPAAPPKPQAYRPPRSSGALAALMRQEETGSKKLDRSKYAPPTRAAAAPVGATPGGIPGFVAPRVIPGMSTAVPTAKSNKNQRKKKNKEVEEAKAAVEAALGIAKPAEEAAPVVAAPPAPVVLTEEEKQKKIKAINKKLKQIDELKAKQAGGATLNEDQQQKLANEVALRKEIEELS